MAAIIQTALLLLSATQAASSDLTPLGSWRFANFHTHPVRVVMGSGQNSNTCKVSSHAFWAACKERNSMDHVELAPGEIMNESLHNVWEVWQETCVLDVLNGNGDRLLTMTLIHHEFTNDPELSLGNVGDRQDAGLYGARQDFEQGQGFNQFVLNICLCVKGEKPNCGDHCANQVAPHGPLGGPQILNKLNASQTFGLRGAASGRVVEVVATKQRVVDDESSEKAREQLKNAARNTMRQP